MSSLVQSRSGLKGVSVDLHASSLGLILFGVGALEITKFEFIDAQKWTIYHSSSNILGRLQRLWFELGSSFDVVGRLASVTIDALSSRSTNKTVNRNPFKSQTKDYLPSLNWILVSCITSGRGTIKTWFSSRHKCTNSNRRRKRSNPNARMMAVTSFVQGGIPSTTDFNIDVPMKNYLLTCCSRITNFLFQSFRCLTNASISLELIFRFLPNLESYLKPTHKSMRNTISTKWSLGIFTVLFWSHKVHHVHARLDHCRFQIHYWIRHDF